MMKLYGWNRIYGCSRFEVYIPENETVFTMLKYKKETDPGFLYWIEKSEEE